MSFGSVEPILGTQKRIQIESETRVNSLRFDIDGPEKVGLPTNVKTVKSDYRKFKIQIAIVIECPQTVLPIDNFEWWKFRWSPICGIRRIRKRNLAALLSLINVYNVLGRNRVFAAHLPRQENIQNYRGRKPT